MSLEEPRRLRRCVWWYWWYLKWEDRDDWMAWFLWSLWLGEVKIFLMGLVGKRWWRQDKWWWRWRWQGWFRTSRGISWSSPPATSSRWHLSAQTLSCENPLLCHHQYHFLVSHCHQDCPHHHQVSWTLIICYKNPDKSVHCKDGELPKGK